MRVFALGDEGVMSFAMELLKSGRYRDRAGELSEEIGEVHFQASTSDARAADLEAMKTAWSAKYPDFPVGRALVVARDEDSGVVDLRRAQGKVIAAAGGGELTDDYMRSTEDIYGDAVGIVLLEPRQG